jgi:transposase-like protein
MESTTPIIEQFISLGEDERSQLLLKLTSLHEQQSSVLVKVRKTIYNTNDRKPCPHCHGIDVSKKGSRNGMRMYYCKPCNKQYSENAGTALWDIKKKDKWQAYIDCMNKGMSLRAIAKEIGISLQTSFDWRHKILGSLNTLTPDQLGEVVECDEMEIAINDKGEKSLERPARKRSNDFKRNTGDGNVTTVQVVTAVDRKGKKYLKAVESKRLNEKQLIKALDKKIKAESIFITDDHPSYKAFVKKQDKLNHKTVKSIRHTDKNDKSIHLQRVNNTHMLLRKFLSKFSGVRTKYLQNYLNWFAYGEQLNSNMNKMWAWLMTVATADQAYDLFQEFKSVGVIIRT